MMEEKSKTETINGDDFNISIDVNENIKRFAYKRGTVFTGLANNNISGISGEIIDISYDNPVYVHEVHVKSVKINNDASDNYPTIASLVANNTGSGKLTYIAPIGGETADYKLGLYPIYKYQYYRVIVSEIANDISFNLTVTLKGGALTNEIKPYGSHYEHFTPMQRNRSVSFDESKNEIISHEAEDDNSLQYSEWIIPSILVGALSVAFFTKK